MIFGLSILNANGPAMLGLTPAQRWTAVMNWTNYVGDKPSLKVLLYGVLVAMLAVAVAAMVAVRRRARQSRRRAFDDSAEGAGLSPTERQLLSYIAGLAGIKDVSAIFTMEQAFMHGASALMQGPRVASMDAGKQEQVAQMIMSLAQKLGFQYQASQAGDPAVHTRTIPVGAELVLVAGGAEAQARVIAVDAAALVVTANPGLAGDGVVLVRYSFMGVSWEFDAEAGIASGDMVRLRHTDKIRVINRRRFPRIATNCPAIVAEFPFLVAGDVLEAAAFVESSLVEIAGPGLLLETAVRSAVGQKLLVVLKFADGTVVQGVAKTRRVMMMHEKLSVVAAEMMDLETEDLAELARQTNLAAHEAPHRSREEQARVLETTTA